MTDARDGASVTRRGFLGMAATAAAAAAATGALPMLGLPAAWGQRSATSTTAAAATGAANPSPLVVSVLDTKCSAGQGTTDAQIDAAVVQQMLDRGILALTGRPNLADAWRQIIPDPTKRIAIKVNLLNQKLYTHRKVVDVVTASLVRHGGVDPQNIIVYDRDPAENARCAGFAPSAEKRSPRFMSVKGAGGPGWVERVTVNGRPAKVAGFLAGDGPLACDYLINIPVPNAHGTDGAVFSASMKNHYGSIERPWEHHDARLPKSVAELSALPCIRQKTRLLVGDAIFLRAQGPHNAPATSAPASLVLGTNSVAFDRVCFEMINQERAKLGHPALKDPYLSIAAGEPYNLGEHRLERIQWVKA